MSSSDAEIWVDGSSEGEVREAVAGLLGNGVDGSAWLRFDVLDATYAVQYAAEWLQKNGLHDSDEVFLRDVGDAMFGVQVSFRSPTGSLWRTVAPVLADTAAAELSRSLQTRTAVRVGDVILCVYDGGRRIFDYADSYGAKRPRDRWTPSARNVGLF